MRKFIKSLSEAKELIEKKIIELRNSGKRDLTFVDFVSKDWKGIEKTRIKIKCNSHNTIVETSYRGFMRRDSWGCSECRIEDKKKNRCLCLTKEDAILKINNKIKELKYNENFDLEFLGFVDNFFSTNSQETHLIIRCKIHNNVEVHPRLNDFLKEGFYCRCCKLEKSTKIVKKTNLEMYARLSYKFGENYDFSPILDESYTKDDVLYNRQVRFICKEHGECSLSYGRLMNIKTFIPCNKCNQEIKREEREKIVLAKIYKSIEYRKQNYDLDLEFLGFVGGKYTNAEDTKLILLCKKHDIIWETTTVHGFISNKSICGCPLCNNHLEEHKCYLILEKLKLNIEKQKKLYCFDSALNKTRLFKVDFYLPDLNTIIEYDGIQHYEPVDYFTGNHSNSIKEYKEQVYRDSLVNKYCISNKINLLRISYKDKNRMENIITTYIRDGIDISTKIIPLQI